MVHVWGSGRDADMHADKNTVPPAPAAPGLCRLARFVLGAAAAVLLSGCAQGPHMLAPEERYPIDRSLVEYPAGYELERLVTGLTAPSKVTVDPDGNVFVAENGAGGSDVHIYGFTPKRERFDVYPVRPPYVAFGRHSFKIYGPIGGMLIHGGKIYISHRDENDMGVITALDYWGGHRTVIAGLPAQGEHGVTDLAIDPRSGRLFFGVGTATNSGVVGLDDYEMGWSREHPEVCDIPYLPLILRGVRFDQPNPAAGLLSPENLVTGPYQPSGASHKIKISGAPESVPKFNGGLFSIPTAGGELKVEAHGIRYPRGLAFNEYGQLYFTNNGMELRGSRPVKEDPDVVLRWVPNADYGWPDYTADLQKITDPRFQPPLEKIIPSGYPGLSFLIDHEASGLVAPNPSVLVQSVFPSQSGAAGMDFIPSDESWREYAGSAIVALSGDRAPFGTGGLKLKGPVGYKVVRVDVDRNQVREFIRNIQPGPASQQGINVNQLERPIDIKFGPGGALYILDHGRMRIRNGKEDVVGSSGQLFRLIPSRKSATTQPLAQKAAE